MTTRSPRVRIGLLCAFVLAATVMSGGFARHASGAIVQVTPSPLAPGLLLINYIAEPGERNRVQATESGGTVVLAESGAPVVLVGEPSGCVQRSTNEVACALPSAFNIGVQLGDADDTALIATTLQQGTGVGGVLGGPGRDVLVGGGGAERLSGGPDDDQLFGGEGYDVLVGDEGSDVLRGGDGND